MVWAWFCPACRRPLAEHFLKEFRWAP
jgi:hypothetical protein